MRGSGAEANVPIKRGARQIALEVARRRASGPRRLRSPRSGRNRAPNLVTVRTRQRAADRALAERAPELDSSPRGRRRPELALPLTSIRWTSQNSTRPSLWPSESEWIKECRVGAWWTHCLLTTWLAGRAAGAAQRRACKSARTSARRSMVATGFPRDRTREHDAISTFVS